MTDFDLTADGVRDVNQALHQLGVKMFFKNCDVPTHPGLADGLREGSDRIDHESLQAMTHHGLGQLAPQLADLVRLQQAHIELYVLAWLDLRGGRCCEFG